MQEAETRSSNPDRLPQLDLLRGVAILLVLWGHAPIPPSDTGPLAPLVLRLGVLGATGVDLFFVLSGFLVGGLLLQEWRRRGAIDVRRFLIRRAFKIWPLYLVYVVFATGWLIAIGTPVAQAIVSMSPNVLHLQSYVQAPPLHTWSLAVEEHFYLALPWIIVFAVGRRWRWRSTALAGLLVTAGIAVGLVVLRSYAHVLLSLGNQPLDFARTLAAYSNPAYLVLLGLQLMSVAVLLLVAGRVRQGGSDSIPAIPIIAVGLMVLCAVFRALNAGLTPALHAGLPFGDFATHLRIDSLFFGVLLGYLYHFRGQALARIGRHRVALFALGLALVVPVAYMSDMGPPFGQMQFSMRYLGYGCFLIALVSADARGGRLGKALASWPARALAFVGYHSYAIYLWHMNPIRHVELGLSGRLDDVIARPARWAVVMTIYVGEVIVIGCLMSRLIEKPGLRLRDRLFPAQLRASAESASPNDHAIVSPVRPSRRMEKSLETREVA